MPVPPPDGAKLVHDGIMAKVYHLPTRLYDGSTRTFEYYVRPDTVGVIAFLDRKTILMTRQEQPGRSGPFWDPPGGQVDPDESAEQAARRELLEETGYRAGRMERWHAERYEGITRFEEYVFVAADLEKVDGHNPEDPGERIEVVPTAWKDAVRMSLKRELRRGEVMLAILGMEFDPEQRKKLKKFFGRM